MIFYKRGQIPMKGINKPIITLIVTKNQKKISSITDCYKIDKLESIINNSIKSKKIKQPVTLTFNHNSNFISNSNSNSNPNPNPNYIDVKTPIPRKFTNIFGMRNQYSLEQIEDFVQKCLNKLTDDNI